MSGKAFTQIRAGRCFLQPLCGRTSPYLPPGSYRGTDLSSLPPIEGDIDYLRNRMGFVMPNSHNVISTQRLELRRTKQAFDSERTALKRRMLMQKILNEEENRNSRAYVKDLKRREQQGTSTTSECGTGFGLPELSEATTFRSTYTLDSSSRQSTKWQEGRRCQGPTAQSSDTNNSELSSGTISYWPR